MHTVTKSEVITIFGCGKVGKTSIIRQFLQHTFIEKYTPTVEDTFSKIIDINGQPVTVQFIDSSGTYSFPAMRRLWIQKATAFLLVFSVTDRDSFDVLDSILSEIRAERSNDFLTNTPLVIAGNKSDSENKDIEDEIVEDWVLSNNIPFDSLVYCSAKTNDSITNLFQSLWEQRRDQIRSSQVIEDLQNTSQRINEINLNSNRQLMFNNTKSKRRFSAFAVLTSSSMNGGPLLNQRRESTAVDTLGSLNGANNNIQSPSTYRGRRGSRASITKLLVGQKPVQKQNDNLKFDCVIS